MAGTHPLICKYAKPVTSGIDGVFLDIEQTGILSKYVPELRKNYQGISLKSLPPVTNDFLIKVHKPFHARFIQQTSKQLVFTKGSTTVTLYTCLRLMVYVAVVTTPRKKTATILGCSENSASACGTHKLFSFLKNKGLILKSVEDYQPPFYGVLDFSEAYLRFIDHLCENVTLTLVEKLPSKAQLQQKHVSTVYIDPYNYIEVINLYDDVFVISLGVKYENHEEYDILLQKPYNFIRYEPAFFEPAEVLEELFAELHL